MFALAALGAGKANCLSGGECAGVRWHPVDCYGPPLMKLMPPCYSQVALAAPEIPTSVTARAAGSNMAAAFRSD